MTIFHTIRDVKTSSYHASKWEGLPPTADKAVLVRRWDGTWVEAHIGLFFGVPIIITGGHWEKGTESAKDGTLWLDVPSITHGETVWMDIPDVTKCHTKDTQERSCTTCKHFGRTDWNKPCKKCFRRRRSARLDMWEPRP